MRLANIVTAISDILAGIAISGYLMRNAWHEINWLPVALLTLATIGLYGGGVVFNDVFDAKLDKVERPERPIPSGLISKGAAAAFASVLLLLGIVMAAFVHPGRLLSASTIIAIATALAAVVYDKWGKHHSFLGPLNMGLCRGLNLLLGISILASALPQFWYLSLVPMIYIAAITMVSRGEVHGGSRSTLYGAMTLYIVVILSILTVGIVNNHLPKTVMFLMGFGSMIFTPLRAAIKEPKGPVIGRAVKTGVIALIMMNAAWAAAFGNVYLALAILVLLPFSLWLAKRFAVT